MTPAPHAVKPDQVRFAVGLFLTATNSAMIPPGHLTMSDGIHVPVSTTARWLPEQGDRASHERQNAAAQLPATK